VLRSDLLDLLPDDPRAERVAGAVRTLAEQLTSAASSTPDGWQPPDLSGRDLIVQPHCHQHAVLGFDVDELLLTDAGATVQVLSGCCGLAGNFGMERGHYELSLAVAEHRLLPALRSAGPDAIVLADGFSCRTQVAHLTGRRSLALAQLLVGDTSGSPRGDAGTAPATVFHRFGRIRKRPHPDSR
jgi:Fe-S oxidoreductase